MAVVDRRRGGMVFGPVEPCSGQADRCAPPRGPEREPRAAMAHAHARGRWKRRGIRPTPKARVAKGTPARLSASRPCPKFCRVLRFRLADLEQEAQLGQDIKIPHAKTAFVDKSQTPREYLVVVPDLPEHSVSGSEARKRQDMLNAIAAKVDELGLQAYDIRWPVGARDRP
jgi:hypothetical protein